MLNNPDYTADQKFVTVTRRASEPNPVPVTFIDEILDRGLSSYELEKLLWFRSVTRNAQKAEWLTMRDVIGRDLTGTTVYFWHANYEDSEWRSVENPVTVKEDEAGEYASFVVPQHVQDWWDDPEGTDDDLTEAEHWKYEYALSTSFHIDETVLVVTHNEQD